MTFRSLATLQGGTSADTGDTPGEPAGTRFVGFGESLTSAISNRPHYALAENTDDLNSRIAPWESGGLDTAYDLGAAAVPGGGRQITKDGGAVETVSALTTYYDDDVANAHYRADATGDTLAQGGGFDFKGSTDAQGVTDGSGWAGYLDRRALGIRSAIGSGSTFAGTESADLNPGGAAASTLRLANVAKKFYTTTAGPSPSAGTYTDLNLQVDLVEITGASAGVYIIWGLGATEQDVTLRDMDGGIPSFSADESVTATFFRVKLGSFGTNFPTPRGFLNANALVADQLGAALNLLASGDEGTVDSVALLASYFRQADGTVAQGGVQLDRFGRIRYLSDSSDLPESHATPGLDWSRQDGGAFVSRVERDAAGAEITHYVLSGSNNCVGRLDFLSMVPLEISGTGLDGSIPFDYVVNSPVDGRVEFTVGAGLGASWEDYLVGGRTTVVEIVTGDIGSMGFYLLDVHDEPNERAYLVNLDGTIPTHFPTSTSGTLRFYCASRLGRVPSTSTGTGLGALNAFTGQNANMTAYNVMMGGSEADSAALVVTSPGNVDPSDDRALIRGLVMDYATSPGSSEIFGVYPGDGPGGPDFGLTRVTNLAATGDIRVNTGNYLYADASGDAATRARTKTVPIQLGVSASDEANQNFWSWQGAWWFPNSTATSSSRDLQFPIDLPRDSILTSIEVLVRPSTARGTVGDRFQFRLYRGTKTWTGSPPGAPTFTSVVLSGAVSVVTDDGTSDRQIVTLTPDSTLTINDTDENEYFLTIEPPDTPLNTDYVEGVRVNFSDPGPRNY